MLFRSASAWLFANFPSLVTTMTTPAVNQNVTTNSIGLIWSGDDVHGIYYTHGGNINIPIAWYKQSRPASTTSHFSQRGGWRPPLGWSHTGTIGHLGDHTVQWRSASPGPNGYTYVTYTGSSYWNPQVPSTPSLSPMTDLVSRAEIRALNKLKRGNVQLGIVMAEAGETASLLGDAMRRIAKQTNHFIDNYPKQWEIVKRLQNGKALITPSILPSSGGKKVYKVLKPKGPRHWASAKKIPSRWLELQYGWNPLMSDVNDALATLEHRRDIAPPIIGVHAKTQRVDDRVSNHTSAYDSGSSFEVLYRTKYECYVDLYFSMANSTLARLSSLGLTDPLGIIWEKVKYSFVVDWFVPIGGWLSSLRADDGYAFQGGSRSLIARLEESPTGKTIYAKPGYRLVLGGSPAYNVKSFNFARQVYGGSPVPGLYFKNPLSSGHIANALSLLTQAFRR